MDRVHLFFVDHNQLFCHALERLLDSTLYSVAGEAPSLAAADAALASGQRVDLLVVEFHGDDKSGYPALLQKARQQRPKLKIAVLTGSRSREDFVEAVSWSIDAFLFKDVSPEALVKSFQLIMLGQQIFPTPLLMTPTRVNGTSSRHVPEAVTSGGLSPQELEILRRVMSGLSNKAIARDLNIGEGSIKAHLKSLLRKMQVTNRTQAAMWAVAHGIQPSLPHNLIEQRPQFRKHSLN
jgi:two-component system, NarL family, nitrate/nitrite response regulator NarL